jgi:hypothetical protein
MRTSFCNSLRALDPREAQPGAVIDGFNYDTDALMTGEPPAEICLAQ